MAKIIEIDIDLSDLYSEAGEIKAGIRFFIPFAQAISEYFFPYRDKEEYWFCSSPDIGDYNINLPGHLKEILNVTDAYDESGNPIDPVMIIAEELAKQGDVIIISIYDGYEALYYYILLK